MHSLLMAECMRLSYVRICASMISDMRYVMIYAITSSPVLKTLAVLGQHVFFYFFLLDGKNVWHLHFNFFAYCILLKKIEMYIYYYFSFLRFAFSLFAFFFAYGILRKIIELRFFFCFVFSFVCIFFCLLHSKGILKKNY